MSRTFMTALLILLLPLWGSTAEADNRYMPIEMDLVEDEIAKHDPDISVLEDDAWRDDQKVYSLKDRDGNTIAFLSSIGENTEGTPDGYHRRRQSLHGPCVLRRLRGEDVQSSRTAYPVRRQRVQQRHL